MRTPRFGLVSILVFVALILVYILIFGVFESAIVGLSPAVERWLAFILLVLPAGIGLVLGVFGLLRPHQNRLLAAIGSLLNLFFGLFILLVLLFAG